ncbi:hypothetical protein HWD72_12285 [Enterococcus hirae]|mgnify:CR=1 FL=1|uniref:hypothetical protein n=1 Tax=Enterococcus TaxID=1350 RepID=UPI0013E3B4C2|nr:hypothetical protein [Enterococcus hirae]EMF0093349.1 hypothetical protein [Enterococcus hirae]MBA5252327.1 hypothetical protein [Enterococcus hirae]
MFEVAIIEDIDLPSDIVVNYRKGIADYNDKFIQNKINKTYLTDRCNICKAILGM